MQHRQVKKRAIPQKTGLSVVDELLGLAGKKHEARFSTDFKKLRLQEQGKKIRALRQNYESIEIEARSFKEEVHQTLGNAHMVKSGYKLLDAKAKLFGILSGKMHALEERLLEAKTVSRNIFAEFHPGTTTRRLTPFEAQALKCERMLHQAGMEYNRARAMVSPGTKLQGRK